MAKVLSFPGFKCGITAEWCSTFPNFPDCSTWFNTTDLVNVFFFLLKYREPSPQYCCSIDIRVFSQKCRDILLLYPSISREPRSRPIQWWDLFSGEFFYLFFLNELWERQPIFWSRLNYAKFLIFLNWKDDFSSQESHLDSQSAANVRR